MGVLIITHVLNKKHSLSYSNSYTCPKPTALVHMLIGIVTTCENKQENCYSAMQLRTSIQIPNISVENE